MMRAFHCSGFEVIPSQPGPVEVMPLSFRAGVILSRTKAIPTGPKSHELLVSNGLRMASRLHYEETDEVARNGVLQRITSARGFL